MASIGIKQLERKILEARGGIEPPIMVLQTIALPLGDRATGLKSCQFSVLSSQFSVISYQSEKNCAQASVLHLQTLGDELSFPFRMVFGCQFPIVSQKEKCVTAFLL